MSSFQGVRLEGSPVIITYRIGISKCSILAPAQSRLFFSPQFNLFVEVAY